MIKQKLDYIHANPCRGSWSLAGSPENYLHSSAKFYLTGQQGIYEVTSYSDLEDIDLTKLTKALSKVKQGRRVPGRRLCGEIRPLATLTRAEKVGCWICSVKWQIT